MTYDAWFSEQSLYENGQFNAAMSLLHDGGYIAQREKATWFMSTALGEDKDNVVIRSDGSPTYFGADIAYHYNKFVERRFDRVIDIWGADHQGHVSRMKAVASALGIDPDRLTIIISQMVTLRRGKEIVRISKRTGDMITLREVIDEVGADACRFFFLSRSADSQMDFDLELAKKQSADNPVYYVQYAHARIASILRLAEEKGHRLLERGRLPADRRRRAVPGAQTAAPAGAYRDGGPDPRTPPSHLLCPGSGYGVPRLLPGLPGGIRRPGADSRPPEAGVGGQDGAGAGPSVSWA